MLSHVYNVLHNQNTFIVHTISTATISVDRVKKIRVEQNTKDKRQKPTNPNEYIY